MANPCGEQELLLRDPVLRDGHRLGRRPHRAAPAQALERRGRDVLELGRDRGAVARELVERAGVGVGRAEVAVGHQAGRARGVGVEHHHVVAHRAGPQGEHPAELTAAEHANGGAGQDHAGSGSVSASTRSVCAARKASSRRGEGRIGECQDGHGGEPRVVRARGADGEGRDRDPGRHLHDREQGVEPLEVGRRNRYAEHRQGGLGGEHPRKVGRAARPGDEAAEPAAARLRRVAEQQVGGPVRAHDAALVRHFELRQPARGVLHDVPVGVAAHHDAHQR